MPEETTISELSFKTIFDSFSEPILVIDKDGAIISFNNKAKESVYKQLGIEIKFGESVYNYIVESDKAFFKEVVNKVLKGEVVKYYYEYNRQSGGKIHLQLIVNPVYNKTSVTQICITGRDITKQKELELADTKYFEEKNDILESIGDAFFVVDSHWTVTYWNAQAERVLSKPKKEIVGYNLWEVFKDSIHSKSYRKYHDAIKNNRITHFEDYYSLLNKWFEIRAYPSSNGLSVYLIDVTERKKTENLLKDSELRYRTLFEQNQTGIYQFTVDGVILDCNKAFAKMLKYNSPKDVLTINAHELYFSADERNCFIANLVEKRKLYNYEVVLKCKDGTPINVLENTSLQKDALTGEDVCEGIIIDITERKNAERSLQESNEKYNLVSKATHDMVWDRNLVTGEVERNAEGWKKIFKTPDDKEAGTKNWLLKIHPDDRDRVRQVVDNAIYSETEHVFEVECKILRDDGTIGYVEDRGYITRNENGKALRVVGATIDITERKNAEQKVLLREHRFRALVQNGFDLIGVIDKEGNYTHSGGSRRKVLGYDAGFLANATPFSFIHPDDSGIIIKALSDLPKNQHLQLAPYRYKYASGEWRWMETSLTNLLDDPEVQGIIANSRDITERKIAEDELKKLSLVARETLNGVIIRDKHQNIIWVNSAFTKIFGYELEEVIGKSPFDFLPGPETDMKIVNYVKKKSNAKKPYVFEILYYTKTGNKVYLRIQVQPIFDENGNFIQSFSLQNDITKQKELEEKIESENFLKQKQITEAAYAAQENERLEIGRELHDNVNQLLGAICLYIDMAKTNEEKRDSLLTSASSFASDALEEIRKLSKTLITPLKEVGLVDSITNLTKDVMLVHPVQILLKTTNFKEGNLNDKFKLNVFRIIQEQINNILKHAKAKTIHVIIKESGNKLLVSISDDGIGFDTRKTSPGVGIINIKSRSELYNGTVVLTSEKGQGTALSLTFNTADRLLSNHN